MKDEDQGTCGVAMNKKTKRERSCEEDAEIGAKRVCHDHDPCENMPINEEESPATPITPKSETPGDGQESSSSALKDRKIKASLREKDRLEKLAIKQQKEDERLRLKAEKEAEKESERLKREEEKMKKEEEKRKREEERLMKKKQKEDELNEKKKIKEAEKEKKDLEKAQKEKERAQKQLETEKKLAEKKAKDEEERKKRELKEEEKHAEKRAKEQTAAKSKMVMQNWLTLRAKSKSPLKPQPVIDSTNVVPWVLPFQLKEHMVVAPAIRRTPLLQGDKAKLSEKVVASSVDVSQLYISELKNGYINPKRNMQSRTRLRSNSSDASVICEDSDAPQIKAARLKGKLLQFVYNGKDEEGAFIKCNRPPYFGTFRKKSDKVSGRNPLKKDTAVLNYCVDSDVEWEDEPVDGEECQSEDEEDNVLEEEEERDGFFVDHGYLSDGEGMSDEEEQMTSDPDVRRERLTAKADAWKADKMGKNRWRKLVPNIAGLCFNDVFHNHQNCDVLKQIKVISNQEGEISTSFTLLRQKQMIV